jgi:hypothetical protein
MRGFELLVPLQQAERERQAAEARLAREASRPAHVHEPVVEDTEMIDLDQPTWDDESVLPVLRGWPYDTSYSRPKHTDSRAKAVNTEPVLQRLVQRFAGRSKTS